MSRMLRSLLVVATVCVAVVSIGCNGNQERIALLEGENQRLLDDCNACQDELMAMRDQYLAMKAENESLRGELADVEVPEGWQAVPGGAMIAIEGSFLFNSGQATLRKTAIPTLQQVVATIDQTYPDTEVLVYGHTATEPIKKSKWKDNFELSAQRALAVVRELGQAGIEKSRLVAGGCGEYQPVADNTTDKGRQQNRRVEIYVLDPKVRTTSR